MIMEITLFWKIIAFAILFLCIGFLQLIGLVPKECIFQGFQVIRENEIINGMAERCYTVFQIGFWMSIIYKSGC